MSRNSSGTYSLPSGNPVVAGTTITVTWGNTTLSDVASELTDSLSRSGKGGMLAALKLVDGAVGAPALAWTSEPTTGLYRAGSNDVRLCVAGVDLLKAASAQITAFTVLSVESGAVQQTAAFKSTNASAGYVAFQNSLASYGLIGSAAALSTGTTSDLAVRSAGSLYFTAGGGTPAIVVDGSNSCSRFQDGSLAAPGISFINDTDTGVFRNGANILRVAVGGASAMEFNVLAVTPFLPILAVDGSAAVPTYTFNSDADTGIYRVGANSIGFSTNGSHKFQISDTALSTPLPIISQQTNNGGTYISTANTSNGNAAISYLAAYNDALRGLILLKTGSNYSGSFLSGGPAGEAAFVYAEGAFPLSLGANGTEHIRITDGGDLTLTTNGGGLVRVNGVSVTNAALFTAGTLADARLSANVPLLNAANVFTGSLSGNGAGLTSLNASNISSGTLADARLSANVSLKPPIVSNDAACDVSAITVGQRAVIYKSTATSRASTTSLSADPVLQFTNAPAGSYIGEINIKVNDGGGGIKFNIGSVADQEIYAIIRSGSTLASYSNQSFSTDLGTPATGANGHFTAERISIGTISLAWAQSAFDAAATVLGGAGFHCSMTLTRVA